MLNMSSCTAWSCLLFFVFCFALTQSKVADDSKLDDYIDSLPEDVFDENFQGNEDDFNAKIDELLADYQSKMKEKETPKQNIDTDKDEPKSSSENEIANSDLKDEDELAADTIKNDNDELQKEEIEGVDDRPQLYENDDAANFYPIMSDEEFNDQERRDMEEIAKREEPEPEVVEDEETIRRYIDEAFREQSFDVNPLVVESDFEDLEKKEAVTSDEWQKPDTEYTGSDIVDIPNDSEYDNLHLMSSMGKIDDPFKTTFEQYDEERKARSLADMESDMLDE